MMSMLAPHKIRSVLIVGAGIGGLGAAIALAQRGIDTEIVEIKNNPCVLGVGINQTASSLRVLRALGVADQIRAHGFSFDRRLTHDMYGRMWFDSVAPSNGDLPSNVGLSRQDLAHVLTEAVDKAGIKISYGTTVVEMAQEAARVEVKLTDGRQLTPHLVVGFDGIRSHIRQMIFGDTVKVAFTGCSCWRITLPRPSTVTCLQSFQGDGCKAGLIPLSDEWMYLYENTSEPTRPYFNPDDFGELLRDRLAGYQGIIGEIRDEITGPDGIVYVPIDVVKMPPPWHSGRVVILGDAAHACPPTLTLGAGMALEDGAVLAEMIDEHPGTVEEMLCDFESRRYPRVRFVQEAALHVLTREIAIRADNLQVAMAAMRDEKPSTFALVNERLERPA